jgi:hypothetical protein
MVVAFFAPGAPRRGATIERSHTRMSDERCVSLVSIADRLLQATQQDVQSVRLIFQG